MNVTNGVSIEIFGAGLAALLLSFLLAPRIGKRAVRFGGVALLLAFAVVVLLHPTLVMTRAIWALLLALLLLLVAGVADDRWNLPWWIQLGVQLLAAGAFVFGGGIVLDYLNAPFAEGEAWRLDRVPLISEAVAIAWLLLVMNAMNWLDGSDGVAPGVGVFGLSVLGTLSMLVGVAQPPLAILAAAGAGAALGVFFWNRPPARVLLGTSGSFGLGFLVGALAILAGAKLATVATVLLLPLADMAAVLTKRLLRGQPLTKGDRSHLHHVLAGRGAKPWMILAMHLTTAAVFGLAALLLPRPAKSITLLAGFLLAWVLLLVLDSPLRRTSVTRGVEVKLRETQAKRREREITSA